VTLLQASLSIHHFSRYFCCYDAGIITLAFSTPANSASRLIYAERDSLIAFSLVHPSVTRPCYVTSVQEFLRWATIWPQ